MAIIFVVNKEVTTAVIIHATIICIIIFPFCCFTDNSGSTLNSNLTVVTGSAVKWTADITINDCKKVGKLCFCNVYASKSSGTITADESLFSVPWAPNNAAYFVVTGRNTTSGATEPIPVYIETEYGTIRATSAHSNSNEVRCYFAYMTT